MIIRHAEKPESNGKAVGVSASGGADPEELIVRGWQRSGALVRFFFPPNNVFADERLGKPSTIFASAVGKHSNSLRPQHTVLELATVLGKPLVLTHLKGDEAALVGDAIAAKGPVLIAWEHEAIPKIANLIVGDTKACPQEWPGSRYDLVWVLDRQDDSGSWSFGQVPQMLLSGDSAEIIPMSEKIR
jgi:hypothetical protein